MAESGRSGNGIQYLLSLPPGAVRQFPGPQGQDERAWFVDNDPPESKLGSGGGTAFLLRQAWQATGKAGAFSSWLDSSRKLLVHGGGQSRRLPAYAAEGKPFCPMPVWRWATGQALDQNLLDLQVPGLEKILCAARPGQRVLVSSGDVLILGDGSLPELPDVDVLCLGLWVAPEEARHFGVFFCRRDRPEELAFFLQKPGVKEIRELSSDHLFLVDTGIWLLSRRAIAVLMGKSGISVEASAQGGEPPCPGTYELYADFGLSLGSHPRKLDPEICGLSSAVIPLPGGEFYHFGNSRDLVLSSSRLQNKVLDQRRFTTTFVKPHPDIYVQNALLDRPLTQDNVCVWVENSRISSGWTLHSEHILTGIPDNDWSLDLPKGSCLDVVPIGERAYCLRPYGIDDPFRGELGSSSTLWLSRPFQAWLEARGLDLASAGLDPSLDIQEAPLFPVLENLAELGHLASWMLGQDKDGAKIWLRSRRLSASDIGREAVLDRLRAQRRAFRLASLPMLAANHARSVFYRIDLGRIATDFAENRLALPPPPDHKPGSDIMRVVHGHMFRAEVLRRQGDPAWREDECAAFGILRKEVIDGVAALAAHPRRGILDDQIVWARSPVRIDLAGGWTDTPPYCFLHGGRVVNLAIDLNGQAPLQCFLRRHEKPEIYLRSIDLGLGDTIREYSQLEDHARVGEGFSIAKAALAIAGFLPAFGASEPSLKAKLENLGGGLELTLLSAVPKGSGLGTSSILAGTVLGALSEGCSLGWSKEDIILRVLALEQMLSTGGGWQDQAGGLLHGIKLLETQEGMVQKPSTRWLPGDLLEGARGNGLTMLYYTGLTRVAKGILQEIVRGMFLNSRRTLSILEETGQHAETMARAIQACDWTAFCRAVGRTWDLKQELDIGTNPPQVQAIIAKVSDYLDAWKLPGAGGGGFLFMVAKDPAAAGLARKALLENPPNANARFVDFSLSGTGMQVTKS